MQEESSAPSLRARLGTFAAFYSVVIVVVFVLGILFKAGWNEAVVLSVLIAPFIGVHWLYDQGLLPSKDRLRRILRRRS